MNPFFCVREVFSRALERKKLLAAFTAGFLACAVVGAVFSKTSAGYAYHLKFCRRFLENVCFSDRSVFLIFLERTAGHALLIALVLLGGVHLAGLCLPAAVLIFRSCTFGGSVVVFFSAYRLTGALVVFALYLPVHLLADALLLAAAALSCGRARSFRFCREDWLLLLRDFLVLTAIAAIVCLAEMILLAALFHPLGNVS